VLRVRFKRTRGARGLLCDQMADSLEMRLVFDRWMGYRYKHGSEVTECV